MKIYCSSESEPHCAPQNENLLLLRKWASLSITKLKNTAPQKMGLIALHKIKIYCSSESEPHCASQNKNLMLLRKWASLRSTKWKFTALQSGPHCAPQNENLMLLRKWVSLRPTKLKITAPQKVSLIACRKMKIYCSSESEPHCAHLKWKIQSPPHTSLQNNIYSSTESQHHFCSF